MKSVRTIIFSALIFLLLPQLSWAANIDSLNRLKYPPGALRVVINGTGFSGVNEVQIFDVTNGVQVAAPRFFIKSDTQIVARPTLWAGTYFIKVKTPQGTSNASPTFAVGSDPPIISAISPTTIPAGTPNMVITGDNFTGVRIVRIYNALTNKRVCDASFTVNSNYQITAAAALTSGSYFLKVITYFGVSNNSQTIHVSPSMAFSLSIVKVNDIDRLKLTVTLDSRATQVTTVEYKAVSGQSSMIFDQPLQGVTTSSGILTFQVDRLQRSVYLPFREGVDKAIMVTLSNPVNATLKSPSLSENLDRKVLVNVKGSDFNAAGDGTTLDKTAVQSAIDRVKDYGGGIVYFPVGTYLVHSIKLPYNTSLVGEGNRESILKAPDRVDLLINFKFWRMFVTGSTPLWQGYKYEGDADSPPLVFQNLVINYNGPNQVGWIGDSYNGEQNFCLELGASNAKPGRLRVILDNCEVKYSCSDGVTICENVDATFLNCDFTSNRRGGITAVGMYSKIKGRNLNFYDSYSTPGGSQFPAIHSEPCNFGYNQSRRVDWDLENVLVEGHITMAPLIDPYPSHWDWDRSVVTLKNVRHNYPNNPRGGFAFFMRNCDFTMIGCDLLAYGHLQGNFSNMLGATKPPTITNSTFRGNITPGGRTPYGVVFVQFTAYGSPGYQPFTDSNLIFDNCTFIKEPSAPIKGGVHGMAESLSLNNKIILKNCIFGTDLAYAVENANFYELENPTVGNPNGYLFNVDGYNGKEFNVSVRNANLTVGRYAYIRGIDGDKDCFITNTNVTVGKNNNIINCYLGGLDNDRLHLSGKRKIIAGDNNPATASTNGLVADEYHLLSGGIYDCIASGGTSNQAGWVGPR